MTTLLDNFTELRAYAHVLMRCESELVRPKNWQSVDVSAKPEMATHEVYGFYGMCMMGTEHLPSLQADCEPNLPWAENHFLERVCGEPLNPGNTWKEWPYSLKADTFRDDKGQFNHNYMERYWPAYAGHTPDGSFEDFRKSPDYAPAPHFGIRHRYGDLHDVVDLFVRDPLTRQAFVPIFFPEDTGVHHQGRVPCTLGYHFILRRNQMHVTYFMRSCDLRRHFNDDCYLTARLVIWLLEQLRTQAPGLFDEVRLGTFTMYATSLHIFRNDWRPLFGDAPIPGAVAGQGFVHQSSRFTSHARANITGASFGGQQISRFPAGGFKPPVK